MPSAQQIRYPTRPVMCASTVLCAHGSRVGMSRGVAGEPSVLGREEAHTALQESIRFTRPRKQKLAAKPILRRRLSVRGAYRLALKRSVGNAGRSLSRSPKRASLEESPTACGRGAAGAGWGVGAS